MQGSGQEQAPEQGQVAAAKKKKSGAKVHRGKEIRACNRYSYRPVVQASL